MVLIDLDGTLLNSNKNITELTANAIKSIKDNTRIVLASARGFCRIKPYLKQLDLLDSKNYTIAFNGGLVMNNLEDKIIDQKIKYSNIKELIKFIVQNVNYEWIFYTYYDRFNINNIDDLNQFILKNDIYKIVCLSTKEDISTLRILANEKYGHLFQITSSELTRIEFVKKGATKLKGIKKLLEKLEIDRTEIIAIGDGENDIDMIEFAGCGIAMGNAPNIVKQVADIIADTNDNDGVGKILIELFENTI